VSDPFPSPTIPARSRTAVFGRLAGPGRADPATLERVLFHLVQEYARHVGHLGIVTELATGASGE
jgi:hypothetical protein